MLKTWTIIALLGSLALAAPAEAQSRGTDKGPDIPRAYVPPPGMCRVWLDDVPAGQQPAPTDCRTALRRKPPKAQVIFGDDYVQGEKKRESTLKGFKEGARAPATPRAAPRSEPRADPPRKQERERPAERRNDRGADGRSARPPGKRPLWKP